MSFSADASRNVSCPIPDEAQAPAYIYSLVDKAALALSGARQRFLPHRILFAGPYTGEFGYEVMQFQGYVRARRPYYEDAHVLTFPGREYLYEGCHVHTHNVELKNAGFWYGRLAPAEAATMANAKARELGLQDYDIFNPSLLCTRYHKLLFWRQEFRLLQEPPLVAKPYDLVFHFRAINKVGPGPIKNYRPEMADELAEHCAKRGLTLACIGHPDYAYCAAGCADFRSVEMRQTVAAICSARLGVGGSSGAMHLMNACGKPTVIWGDGASLRWNPFRVPIHFMAETVWQPSPHEVCRAVLKAFEDLRAWTRDFIDPPYTLPAQPIAYV
jgi:ADP-heptose:LPS heptosyltransferase